MTTMKKYYAIEFCEDSMFCQTMVLIAHNYDDARHYAFQWTERKKRELPLFYADLTVSHIYPITEERYYKAVENGTESHCTNIHLLMN